ncbi:MAG: prepilin-type N-terminal cleavage/methylation domain-containing protein [Planctomycetes bacterium]|nr:prepilin-type N-terminal cleavage/methylation domain-containing protein [Planctomycetota bacterium]
MKMKKGFTLVELLLVVLIISVLASIVVPRMSGAAAGAANAKDEANWANLVRALELYASNNNGQYPLNQSAFDLGILKSKTYFPHGEPVCPHGASYVYVATSGQQTVTKHAAGK